MASLPIWPNPVAMISGCGSTECPPTERSYETADEKYTFDSHGDTLESIGRFVFPEATEVVCEIRFLRINYQMICDVLHPGSLPRGAFRFVTL